MSSESAGRKCRCCKEIFVPDYRNGHQQLYCPKPLCRASSKSASQRRWLSKPANRDYFRSCENVLRVQQWRDEHPGYWKKKSAELNKQLPAPQLLPTSSPLVTQSKRSGALQDVCLSQNPAFVGLISMVTGATLQEDIASTTRRLEARGRDILGFATSRGP